MSEGDIKNIMDLLLNPDIKNVKIARLILATNFKKINPDYLIDIANRLSKHFFDFIKETTIEKNINLPFCKVQKICEFWYAIKINAYRGLKNRYGINKVTFFDCLQSKKEFPDKQKRFSIHDVLKSEFVIHYQIPLYFLSCLKATNSTKQILMYKQNESEVAYLSIWKQ